MMPARGPQREVPARRVTGQDNPTCVDGRQSAGRVGDETGQPVDGRRDIIERPRPPATGLSGSAIFRRTYNNSGRRQRLSERRRVLSSILGAPETAMKKYCQQGPLAGPVLECRRCCGRDMDIGDMVGPFSVSQYEVRGAGRPAEDVSPAGVQAISPTLIVHQTAISKTLVMHWRNRIIMNLFARALPISPSVSRAASLCSDTWPPRRTVRNPDHA